MAGDCVVFAILLPITYFGLEKKGDRLHLLERFARSLQRTTLTDSDKTAGSTFRFRVYLAIDPNDVYLQITDDNGANPAEALLRAEGIGAVTTLDSLPKAAGGHICDIWRLLAERATADGCDYFALMNGDVEFVNGGRWMEAAHEEFQAIALTQRAPAGFGCVAFSNINGTQSFTIISALHMDVFNDVVPPTVNGQDGDQFLFQLYRRWGCARMVSTQLSSAGANRDSAPYQKLSAVDWTFEALDNAGAQVESWLKTNAPAIDRKLTLDIVIPSYRVQIDLLEGILNLETSPTCMTTFIIIVDDPDSPAIGELKSRFGTRVNVRIRVNPQNLGASLSRNRGLYESAAEWVFFLDDDVQPSPDLLLAAERAIRAAPDAAGFVGSVHFPRATSVLTTSIHLAGVLNFWDIADKWRPGEDDVPWGVTANLIARRNVRDGVEFDTRFPKTGGGEDIDFCRQKRRAVLDRGGRGFVPAPEVRAVHPWWNGGSPPFYRFFMWSVGDGALVQMYPDLSYYDAAPNSAELFLLTSVASLAGLYYAMAAGDLSLLGLCAMFAACVVVANVFHDVYRHLWRDAGRWQDLDTSARGARWAAAAALSGVLRLYVEAGRTAGILQRREFGAIGRRFEWFAWRWGKEPMRDERKNSVQRLGLAFLLFVVCRWQLSCLL